MSRDMRTAMSPQQSDDSQVKAADDNEIDNVGAPTHPRQTPGGGGGGDQQRGAGDRDDHTPGRQWQHRKNDQRTHHEHPSTLATANAS